MDKDKDNQQKIAQEMTLRDYFAAAALTGLLVSGQRRWAVNARWAYQQADEMLEARADDGE